MLWWASGTLAFVAFALGVVSLFGPHSGPVRVALEAPGRTLLAGLALLVAVPALAVAAFMTGIGLGVGLLLLAALPGLLVAGYVVGGSRWARPALPGSGPRGATARGVRRPPPRSA